MGEVKKRVGAAVKLVRVQTAQPAVQVQVGGLAGQTSVMMKISISHGGTAFKVINDHGDADEDCNHQGKTNYEKVENH